MTRKQRAKASSGKKAARVKTRKAKPKAWARPKAPARPKVPARPAKAEAAPAASPAAPAAGPPPAQPNGGENRERRSRSARRRTKVGFIGLGLMGAPMAANLVRAGFTVQVWNRTPEKCQPLVAEGAIQAPSPAAAARGADVVIVMVADDAALDQVLFAEEGLSRGMKRGAILVNSSTTSPGLGFRAATALRSLSVRYLEAPVMRSVQAAREGRLQILLGGSAEDVEKARPVLECLGTDLHHIGEIGKASTMKLACNLLVAATTAAFAECFVMARKSAIPFETMMEVLHAGPVDSQILNAAEQIVVNPGGRPSFYLRHMLKDLNLALELARQLDVPAPVTATVRQMLTAAKNLDHGNEDFGAIVDLLAQWACVAVRG
jgi:3-hydroxyisobutyrate dehydrogenase